MALFPHSLPDLLAAAKTVCPIRYQAVSNPDRPALVEPDRTWTYAELDADIGRAEALLLKEGPNPLHLAVYRVGARDTIVWLFAAIRSGGTVLLIGDRQPLEAIRQLGRTSEYSLMISSLAVDGTKYVMHPDRYAAEATASGRTRVGSELGKAERLREAELTLDVPATRMFTSGTSGRPQIAVHSVRNHLASALMSNDRIHLTMDSVWLLSLPLSHVSGLGILFRSMIAGGRIAIPDESWSLGQAVEAFGATHVSAVPTQLRRLLNEVGSAPPQMETVLLGGGPIEAALVRKAVRAGYPVRTTYGMTEFTSQITTSEIWQDERERYSAGRPLNRTEVMLAEDGEILVRGPGRFTGYAQVGIHDARPLSEAWFPTNDVGGMVAGELFLLGRKDQLFVSGGENIHPEEIELELLAFDEVNSAVVIAVPDTEFGFRPAVAIQWANAAAEHADVIERLKERLPGFKIPVAVLPWPEHMASSDIKIDRCEVQKEALKSWAERAEAHG